MLPGADMGAPRVVFVKAHPATSPEPTPAQAASGNYKKRAMKWQGLTIRIENEAGSYRRGRSRDGKEWEVRMIFPYGEIARTEGVDGDPVDVIVGPYLDAPMVYVVHQRRYGDWSKYDEDKCCIGFDSEESATAAFLANYDDPRFLGPITAMPVAEFVAKVRATRKAPAMIKAVQMITRKDGVAQRYHVADKPEPKHEQKLADDMEAQMAWLEAQAVEMGYAGIEDLVARNYPAFEALATKWRDDHPVEVALKSFADAMLKARVGPYIRQGKLVNLGGYDGRAARAVKAPGQADLFGEDEAPTPKPKKAEMARHDHTKTADLFEDAPAARVKQTETRAFKEWFGNSKVRDENGEPLRMYHITPHDFDTFHPGGKEALDGHPEGQSGPAIWFSPFKDDQPAAHNTNPGLKARREGAKYREGTNVMPVFLRIERPLMIDDKEMLEWARQVFAEGSGEFPQVVLSKWRDEIVKEGYDGIIFRGDALGWGEKAAEYIVFDPHQIKSAIGNNGDFSKDSPVITKSMPILFLKAKLKGDDRTVDMFSTHVETRTRKDGHVQKYHVANAKKDAALDAAISHLKEDAKQADMPAHERKEDKALVAKLEEARKPATQKKEAPTAENIMAKLDGDDHEGAADLVARAKSADLEAFGRQIGFYRKNQEPVNAYKDRLRSVLPDMTKTKRTEAATKKKTWDRLAALAHDYDRMKDWLGAPEGSYDGKWMSHDDAEKHLISELNKMRSAPYFDEMAAMVRNARPRIFEAAEAAKLDEARGGTGNDTAARRKAALAVLGDDWRSTPDGKKDAYKRSVKLADGGRYEVMIKPARTVAGNFYVGSYFHGGKRSGPGNAVDHPKTLEEAKAVAEGWIAKVEPVKPGVLNDQLGLGVLQPAPSGDDHPAPIPRGMLNGLSDADRERWKGLHREQHELRYWHLPKLRKEMERHQGAINRALEEHNDHKRTAEDRLMAHDPDRQKAHRDAADKAFKRYQSALAKKEAAVARHQQMHDRMTRLGKEKDKILPKSGDLDFVWASQRYRDTHEREQHERDTFKTYSEHFKAKPQMAKSLPCSAPRVIVIRSSP